MNIRSDKIGLRLASALLLHYGEVSVGDIRALPVFSRPEEAEAVIRALINNFKVEIYTKKVASKPIPEWEEIIRLQE